MPPRLLITNHRDLDLLGDTGILPVGRVGSSTDGGASMRTLIQDSLDAAILQVVRLVESSGHFGVVGLVSLSAVAAKRSREFVGAGDAGEFADGRDDQRTNARNGRGDDDDGALDVTPADQLDSTSCAKVGNAGQRTQFRGFDNGGNHGAMVHIHVRIGRRSKPGGIWKRT